MSFLAVFVVAGQVPQQHLLLIGQIGFCQNIRSLSDNYAHKYDLQGGGSIFFNGAHDAVHVPPNGGAWNGPIGVKFVYDRTQFFLCEPKPFKKADRSSS